jgi:hypothetical protein
LVDSSALAGERFEDLFGGRDHTVLAGRYRRDQRVDEGV